MKRQRGVALLLVLWAFMVLGVLALDFSGWMREDARAGVNFAEETQAYYEAHAAQQIALENARRRMEDAQGDGDLLEEERGEFHGVPWEVTVRPECGRIPLNYIARKAAGEGGEPGEPEAPAAREVLKRVVTNLLHGGNRTRGMDNRTAKEIDAIVDAILDWVDSDTEERPNGADEPWYEANRGYLPRGYPFLAPEELLGVKGVTPELFYGSGDNPGLRDIVSVWCGGFDPSSEDVKIDAWGVAPGVLRVLVPDLTPQELEDLLALRESGDKIGFLGMLRGRLTDPLIADLFDFEPEAVPTVVSVTVRAGREGDRNRSESAGVFKIDPGDVPLLLVWYDRAPFAVAPPSGLIPDEAP